MQNLYGFETSELYKQSIFCFIAHGKFRRIYRSHPHVFTGSNLAIHCFLLSLEEWIQKNKNIRPQEVFYSTDGGPENFTKNFIALAHYIVHKRITKRLVLRRLPVGHTHSDPDGFFGNSHTKARDSMLITPQHYEAMLKELLEMHHLDSVVKDIWAVPDYDSFMNDSRDRQFGNYKFKSNATLIIILEAVDPVVFPEFQFGVKMTYRLYAADVVQEIVPTSENEIGLRVQTLYVTTGN